MFLFIYYLMIIYFLFKSDREMISIYFFILKNVFFLSYFLLFFFFIFSSHSTLFLIFNSCIFIFFFLWFRILCSLVFYLYDINYVNKIKKIFDLMYQKIRIHCHLLYLLISSFLIFFNFLSKYHSFFIKVILVVFFLYTLFLLKNPSFIYCSEKSELIIKIIKHSSLFHLFGHPNEIGSYGYLLLKETKKNICTLPFGIFNEGVNGFKGYNCDTFRMCTVTNMIKDKYEFKNMFNNLDVDKYTFEKIHNKIWVLLNSYPDMTVVIDTINSTYIIDLLKKFNSSLLYHNRLIIINSHATFHETSVDILNQKLDSNLNVIYNHLPSNKCRALDEIRSHLSTHDFNDVNSVLDLNTKENYITEKNNLKSRVYAVGTQDFKLKEIFNLKEKEKNIIKLGVKNIIEKQKL